jgi:hypothetical protein
VAIVAAVFVASGLRRTKARGDLPFWPLAFSVVLALPYLPWLPDALPILRSLAGPGRWIVWLVIAGLALWSSRHSRVTNLTMSARGGAAAVFLASLLAIGTAASQLAGTALFPGGDEPHYLVITQSLLKDHDLEIENNHAREDYAAYFHPPLQPHYLTRGVDHEIYSVHPIGLPILVAPAFAIAGYAGVVAFLVLLAAVVATLVWWRAFDLTRSTGAATFGWAATCLTSPFLFNAFAVYPEIAAAACVMAAFPWRSDAASGTWLARSLALAALPWLSSKYVAMAAVLVAIALGHAKGRVRPALLVLLPLGVSLAGWLWFFYAFWGVPSPAAPYGGDSNTRPGTLLAGGPGLWLDQEYGLLAYAPVLLLLFPGLIAMWRASPQIAARRSIEGRRMAVELALVFGALLATVGSFHIWWGGSASPGRPVIAALPLLGLPMAWQFHAARTRPTHRAGQFVLLFGSLGVSLVLLFAEQGLLLANDRSGSARLLEWLSIGGELPRLFPSFIVDPPAIAIGKASIWIAVAAGAAWVIGRISQSSADRAGVGAIATAFSAVLLASAILPVAFGGIFRLKPEATTRSSSALLDTFDASRRPIGVAYDPLRRIDAREIPPLFPLVARGDRPIQGQPASPLWNTRFALPAGTYRIDLQRSPNASLQPPAGSLALTVGRRGMPIETWPLSHASPGGVGVEVPIDLDFVGFRLIPDTESSSFEELRLTPLRIVDASRRPQTMAVVQAVSYGDNVVYFHDENAFAESSGFWAKGDASATLTIHPPREARGVTLRLHGGPVRHHARLHSETWEYDAYLDPGTPQEIVVPRPEGSPVILLRIWATTGFVPARVDRRSTDQRFLGCWVQIVSSR